MPSSIISLLLVRLILVFISSLLGGWILCQVAIGAPAYWLLFAIVLGPMCGWWIRRG